MQPIYERTLRKQAFSAWLKAELDKGSGRKKPGRWTYQEFAEALGAGVNVSTVRNWVGGRKDVPAPRHWPRIARVLGVDRKDVAELATMSGLDADRAAAVDRVLARLVEQREAALARHAASHAEVLRLRERLSNVEAGGSTLATALAHLEAASALNEERAEAANARNEKRDDVPGGKAPAATVRSILLAAGHMPLEAQTHILDLFRAVVLGIDRTWQEVATLAAMTPRERGIQRTATRLRLATAKRMTSEQAEARVRKARDRGDKIRGEE